KPRPRPGPQTVLVQLNKQVASWTSTTQTALIYIHNVTLCLSSITLLCYSLCEISGQKNEVAGSTGVVRTTSGRGAIVSIAPLPEYASALSSGIQSALIYH